MTITAVEALELGQLLGSLLGSVVQAQAESARATVEFIEDVGFETVAGSEHLRTVRIRYQKKNESNEQSEFEVELPLLSLVNVPSLAVKQAKLTFSYDVVTATEGGSSGPSKIGSSGVLAARLKGFIRPQSSAPGASRRTTAIDLEVTLEQQELPLGVERLFDLAELGITERPTQPPPP
jgi:hypothetical protein